MHVIATVQAPVETDADTCVVAVFDGKSVPHDVEDGALQALFDRGEAKTKKGHLAVAHAAGKRWILVGLGSREDFDGEAARRAATKVLARAKELGTATLCWELPHKLDDAQAAAFVEGTVLADYAFDAFKPKKDDAPTGVETVVFSDHSDRSEAVRRGDAVARAANKVRDLMNLPSNVCTPTYLADFARGIEGVSVDVQGREQLVDRGMGAFAAVAQGTRVEPQLITITYDGGGGGPLIGLIGKAVTHDTGGVSIKPAGNMHKMKFDMGGGAAVLGAVVAAAELQLPVRFVAVIGATENVVGGDAVKPGDIVSAMDGTTIEVNNTDAEGRMVLCDCILHARELGVERLVDAATLTGGIVTALGDVYAGIFSDGEEWHAELMAASERSGELLWRMPLHADYAEHVKGRYAQLTNSPDNKPKGHAISGAEFIHHFTGGLPWAHLDIAGVAYDLSSRPYASKGASGWGVRLLTELLAG